MDRPSEDKLKYRLLTGPDDKSFCENVSKALDEGYILYGSPSITFNGERCIVAQAVVLGAAPFPSLVPSLVPRLV